MNTLTITSTISNNANDELRNSSVTPLPKEALDQFISIKQPLQVNLVGMPQGKAGQEITKAAKTAWEQWDTNRPKNIPDPLLQSDYVDYNPVTPKKSYTILTRISSVKRGKPSTGW